CAGRRRSACRYVSRIHAVLRIAREARGKIARRSRGLAHAPEERQRPLRDAGDVRAPGLMGEEETGRSVDRVLAGGLVEAADCGLLFVEIACLVPGRDLGFDLRAGRPAEPGLVAVGADRGIARRVDADGAGVPGMEHLPAALARGRLLRPA